MKCCMNIALFGATALVAATPMCAFLLSSIPSLASESTLLKAKTISVLRAKARGEGYGPPLENISETIGNTPMVKISDRTCPPGVCTDMFSVLRGGYFFLFYHGFNRPSLCVLCSDDYLCQMRILQSSFFRQG